MILKQKNILLIMLILSIKNIIGMDTLDENQNKSQIRTTSSTISLAEFYEEKLQKAALAELNGNFDTACAVIYNLNAPILNGHSVTELTHGSVKKQLTLPGKPRIILRFRYIGGGCFECLQTVCHQRYHSNLAELITHTYEFHQ